MSIIPRDKAERFGHFFKALARDRDSMLWCDKNDVDYRQRQASEGTNSAGGFLVPEGFDSVPIDIMPTVGAFRRGTDVRPSTSDYQFRPRLSGSMTASYVAEGSSIPESQVLLSAVESVPKRIATMTRVPSELMEDTPIAIADWLVPEIRQALDSLEDDVAWIGDGSPTYGGVLGLSSALIGLASGVIAGTAHDEFGLIDTTDVSNMVGSVETAALPGAAWYTSSAGFGLALTRLSAETGGIMMRNNPDGTVTPIFMGWPVLLSSRLPDISTSLNGAMMMAFGDLRRSSALVERQPTTVSLSYQMAFDKDEVVIRASRRIAIVHHNIGTATVKGPIAILIGSKDRSLSGARTNLIMSSAAPSAVHT